MDKSPDAFRTISEVADWLGVQAHVLRFWESKFPQVKPVKRAGGRRYYRPSDMKLIGGIKKLLHDDGLTIKGAQKLLREQGVTHVAEMSQPLDEVSGSAVAAAESGPTVVAFASKTAAKARAAEQIDLALETASPADPDPVADPAADVPAPPAEPEPEPVAEATAKEDPVTEPAPAPAADPEKPSFLSRPAPEPLRARAIDAADPPADDEMPYAAGALARLARINRLQKADAAALAPFASELKAWRDRSSGTSQV